MAHQCVRCARQYSNQSPELLKGCVCGGRVFLFLREGGMAVPQPGQVVGKTVAGVTNLGGAITSVAMLTEEQKAKIEKELAPLAADKPVSIQLDAENIRVVSKGHYLIDIKSLFSGEPVIIRNAKGVYYVHFPLQKPKRKARKS